MGVFGPYVLATWVGNFSGKTNTAYVGATVAAPLFFQIVNAVARDRGPLPSILPNPATLNLTRVMVCEASGMLPTPYCPNQQETWFIPGKSPIKTDTVYREIAINSLTGLRTCHFDANTRWQVYEFWSSDILRIFAQAGMQRSLPPPFEAGCSLFETTVGVPPVILSPRANVTYSLRLNQPPQTIMLDASADADVRKLYWFINNELLGTATLDQPLAWQAKAGRYHLRVVDDHGRSSSRELIIENVE